MTTSKPSSPLKDTVQAKLNFHLDPEYGGVTHIDPTVKFDRVKYNTQEVTIRNVRSRESEFTLDEAGFRFLEYPSSVKDFSDQEEISATYYKEVDQLMNTIYGKPGEGRRLFVKSYLTLYRSSKLTENEPKNDRIKEFGPATSVHVDYSYTGSPAYLEHAHWSPTNWNSLSKGRWALFSIWRPTGLVTRDQLCVSDKRTLDDADLVDGTTSQSEPGVKGGNGLFWVKYNPRQQYYYKDGMSVDDVIVIKLFDTTTDGRARCSPHCSFTSNLDHGGPRKSIEVRCLVVWDYDNTS